MSQRNRMSVRRAGPMSRGIAIARRPAAPIAMWSTALMSFAAGLTRLLPDSIIGSRSIGANARILAGCRAAGFAMCGAVQ